MPLSLVPASVPMTVQGLPEGEGAIRETLRQMVALVRQYKKDIGIITLARQIIDAAPGPANAKNYRDFVTLLQHFVRDRIRYVPDIHDTEMLQTPIRTLQIATGDCDDKATLLAALLASIGFATRFVALGFKNGPYTHVLAEVKLGTRWVPLETILDGKEPGWFPDGVTSALPYYV